MFRRSDFKRLEMLGSGKRNTKIYKAIHLATGATYAVKEIEAKDLEKLNEYKEEAVQLMKVHNHPNVIRSYGYYFSETKYSSFKLGIVTEYLEGNDNLEYLYRRNKKTGQGWSEQELLLMFCSAVSTCSFLQSKGISHRDIKPANLFVTANGEIKLIDFGESKDYFYDPNDQDRETFTMATIRGTPQYLSPVLLRAHTGDRTSRFAEHNIYKSDVFSAGLVLMQLALMAQVTDFNRKGTGQRLIKESLKMVEKIYSANLAQLLGVMLRFEESYRPSFCEVQVLFYEKEQSSRQKGKPINEHIVFYNRHYNNITKNNHQTGEVATLKNTFPIQQAESNHNNNTTSTQPQPLAEDVLDTAVSSKKNYYKDSTLVLHESCYWFEFGGSSIGRFSINRQKWKIDPGNEAKKFPAHFSVVYVPLVNGYFLLGGERNENFRIFYESTKKLSMNKTQMPTLRNFFAALYYNQRVYAFGGYNREVKEQLDTCETYDINSGKWIPLAPLKTPRSQAAACRINDEEILVCGGYSKELGTLDTIERYWLNRDRMELLGSIKLPIPLRRFMVVRVEQNKALILGGLTRGSRESQRVFKLDYERQVFSELENLEKGGVMENEVLVDSDGSLHIFLEHASGTSPHAHIRYCYDPGNDGPYETRPM